MHIIHPWHNFFKGKFSLGPVARGTIIHLRIMRKEIFLGVNWPRENCPGSIIWRAIIRDSIIWGNYLGGNYLGGNHPGDNFPLGKLSRLLTIQFLQATLFLQAILLLFYVTGLALLITFSKLISFAPSAKLVCTAYYFPFNNGSVSQYCCWKLTDF